MDADSDPGATSPKRERISFCKKCGRDFLWRLKICPHCGQHEDQPVDPSVPGVRWWLSAVSGESFDNDNGTNRQEILARTFAAMFVRLEREPTNRYDRHAVRVLLEKTGEQIGYIPKEHSEGISQAIAKGMQHLVTIRQVAGGVPGRPSRGAVLLVVEYPTTVSKQDAMRTLVFATSSTR